MAEIVFEQFSKAYGKVRAVQGMDLSIEMGEIVGFVGKNGAGKSTTLRAMMNMIFPTEGKITVGGFDSVKQTKEIRHITSYVPAEAALYENVTSQALFQLCLQFSGESFERAEELADFFELDLKKKISELSMGNRKKVSIIQALLKNARLIVLDEPTSGLDPLMQSKFFELILKEKAKGTTVFLSSHNLSEIEKYCDRVIIIKDGEIIDALDMKTVKIAHRQTVAYTLKSGETKSFEHSGDINALIAQLSTLDLESLEIKNTTIEDEFIKYYREGGENA